MDLSVAVVGKYVYAEPLEEMFARGFEKIGARVIRWGPNTAVPPDLVMDLVLCVKAPPPVRVHDRKYALYFADLTSRFPDQWRGLSSFDFDAIFLPHKEPAVDRKRVFHVPVGYDPQFHADVGWSPGDYAAFVGTYTPDREWLRKYPEVQIRGNGWGAGTRDVYGVKRAAFYRECRFALNWHNPGETANMRQFEVPAMGVPMVSDKGWPFPQDAVDTYTDKLNAVEAWYYYQDDRTELARLAKAGQAAVKPHTYAQRCETILKLMGLT